MFVLPTFACALLWATVPLVSSTPFFPTFTPLPNGINCEGSSQCGSRGLSPTVSQEITNLLDVYAGEDDRYYPAGAQIGGAMLLHGAMSMITNTSQIVIISTWRTTRQTPIMEYAPSWKAPERLRGR